jgi:hypothetical protein
VLEFTRRRISDTGVRTTRSDLLVLLRRISQRDDVKRIVVLLVQQARQLGCYRVPLTVTMLNRRLTAFTGLWDSRQPITVSSWSCGDPM